MERNFFFINFNFSTNLAPVTVFHSWLAEEEINEIARLKTAYKMWIIQPIVVVLLRAYNVSIAKL